MHEGPGALAFLTGSTEEQRFNIRFTAAILWVKGFALHTCVWSSRGLFGGPALILPFLGNEGGLQVANSSPMRHVTRSTK